MIGDRFKIHQPQTNKLNKNENVTNYKYTAFAWYFQAVVGQKRNIINLYSRGCSVGSIWGKEKKKSNDPNSQSVPFGSLPPHVSLPLTVNGLIQLLVILLHGVHVAQVAYTQRDGDQSKSHHRFVRFDEKFGIDSPEQGGSLGAPQSRRPVTFLPGTLLHFAGLLL